MIFLGKKAATLEEARRIAEEALVDGSGYKKFKQVVAAQGGNPQALDKFELLPNATGMREVASPRGGYVSSIDAEDIGIASNMIGAGRDKKEDAIDPAVGIILEVKTGEKVDAGSVLVPPLLHQGRPRGRSRRDGGRRLPHLRAEARGAGTHSGSSRVMGRFTGFLGLAVIWRSPGCAFQPQERHQAAHPRLGAGLQFAFALLVLKTDFGKMLQAIGAGVNNMLGYVQGRHASSCSGSWAIRPVFGVIFAFQVLPIIIFIASFFSILYYLGVMQWWCGGWPS
jgi:hypothetical protein